MLTNHSELTLAIFNFFYSLSVIFPFTRFSECLLDLVNYELLVFLFHKLLLFVVFNTTVTEVLFPIQTLHVLKWSKFQVLSAD